MEMSNEMHFFDTWPSTPKPRTTRLPTCPLLVRLKRAPYSRLALSRHIIRNNADYYNGLRAVTTDGAWEPWLLYMLRGVADTARWTTRKIVALRSLIEETAERMRKHAPQIYSRELAELIFVRPYCRIGHLVEAGLGHRQTASVHLKQLVAIGILRKHKLGREKLFLHPGFIELLKQD